MNILGIGPGIKLGHHDSSAALYSNGMLIAASEEERFKNYKHARSLFPIDAIKYCLLVGDLEINEIDIVSSPLITYPNYEKRLQRLFEFHFGFSPKIKLHHHHLCHAASSFYKSNINHSLILTIDNSGDGASGLVAIGHRNEISEIDYLDRAHSLGVFYSMITQFLGFRAHNDEYKVMGLASYGKANLVDKLEKVFKYLENGTFYFDQSYNSRVEHSEIYTTDFGSFQESFFTGKLIELLGFKPRLYGQEIQSLHKNLAASLQTHVEIMILSLLRPYKIKYPEIKKLCLAGGLFLNCKLNYEIINSGLFENVFIQPAAGDAGVSMGAALIDVAKYGELIQYPKSFVFSGPQYKKEEIINILHRNKIPFHEEKDITEYAARKIAEGKIIGWFQGRAEWGPRALGNRSILADPRLPKMSEIINRQIKFREEFRPFACSILEEELYNYFECKQLDPYMLTLARVKKEKAIMIPAIIHYDGTSRIQTVSSDLNPMFYSLISKFFEITGIPMVLNTSLNIDGMPLASRFDEALKVFFTSGLDILIADSLILSKEVLL